MHFCIRDDDTSFFTAPEELEKAYGEISRHGPISFAVVPFHRAGTSKAVPEKLRGRWTVHPLHENGCLVDYLRDRIRKGRFEIMLHGYHHDDPDRRSEFSSNHDLTGKVADGRKYLEDLLQTRIRVFVPPHNAVSRAGLRALAQEGLHLGGTTGLRCGWRRLSPSSWRIWLRLRRWSHSGGAGVPWVLDLGDHREIGGNAITPLSSLDYNRRAFDAALHVGGVFCAATHYWEFQATSSHPGEPPVGEQLKYLVDRVRSDPRVVWRSVGDAIANGPTI